MATDLNEINFDGDEPIQVDLISGSLPVLPVHSLRFEEHGVRVEQHEPSPEGGYVRHVSFVPYSNTKRIWQGYLVGGAS